MIKNDNYSDDYDSINYIIASELTPNLNEPVKIKFTHFKSPQNFYVQLSCNEIKYRIMSDSMQSYYNYIQNLSATTPNSTNFKLNDVVAAFSETNNAWYRAKIEYVSPNFFQVFFLDFGHRSCVKINHVQKLINLFSRLSPQALNCCLKDFKEWPFNFLSSNYINSEALCSFIGYECGIYSVTLYKLDKSLLLTEPAYDLNQLMLKKSFSVIEPKLLELVPVFLKFSSFPQSFFVQLECQKSVHDLIEQEMQLFYNSINFKSNIDFKSLNKNDLVACKFEEDDKWYRARVENIDFNSKKVKVFYIDYGNLVESDFDCIETLDLKFYSTSAQAIECFVNHPKTWPDNFIDTHFHLLCKFCEKAKDGKYLVELYDLTNKVPIFLKTPLVPIQASTQATTTTTFSKPVEIEKTQVRRVQFTDIERHHPILGNKYLMTLSDISSPASFYGHLLNFKEYQQLELDMQSYYNSNKNKFNLKIKPDDLKNGLIFCCQYSENDCWYRAKLIDVPTNQQNQTNFTAIFIDYGNIENTSLQKMKYLDDKFIKVQSQAVKCCIKGIDSWPSGFEDMFYLTDVLCEFVDTDSSGDLYFVNLYYPETEEVILKSKITSVINILTTKPELKKQIIKLTSLISPKLFYCRLDSNENEFQNFDKKLQNYYKSIKNTSDLNLAFYDAKVRDFVVCRHPTNQNWYRAQIFEKDEQNLKLKVIYIDYGIKEEAKMNEVKMISNQFTLLPSQAIKCRTKDIDVWPNRIEHSLILKNVIADFIDIDEKDGICFVQLFDIETQEPIIDENSFISSNLNKSVFKTIKNFKPILNYKQTIIKLTYLPSPKSFWVRLDSMSNKYEELEQELQTYYNRNENEVKLKLNLDQVNVNDFIVCRFQEDKIWYRAQILKKDSNIFKVLYIDYGNEKECSIDNAKVLLDKFKDLKAQAILCCLNFVDKWPNEFEEKFLYTNTYCEFTKAVIKENGQTMYDVKLYDFQTKNNLFPVSIYVPKLAPNLNSKYSVLLTHIPSPSSFYCQILPENNEFRKMGEEMQSYIDNNIKMLKMNPKDIKIGKYIAALFEEDNCWYRAKIEMINKNKKSCKIFFIDYGNETWINIDKVFKLDERFQHVSCQAINCSIRGTDKWPLKFVDDYYFEKIGCIFKGKDKNVESLYLVDLFDEEKNISLKSQDSEKEMENENIRKMKEKEQKENLSSAKSDSIQIEISPEIDNHINDSLPVQEIQFLIQFDSETKGNQNQINTSELCLVPVSNQPVSLLDASPDF